MGNTINVRVAKKTQVFENPAIGTKAGFRLKLVEQIVGKEVQTELGTAPAPVFGRSFTVKLKGTHLEEGNVLDLNLDNWKVKEEQFVNEHGETKTALKLYAL